MVILGIDPGYAIVGYGVLDYQSSRFTTYAYGAIITPAGKPFGQRLQQIYEEMLRILTKYRPQALSIEKLYFTNNKTTAIDVAQARGVILLAAQQTGVAVSEYTPMQVKQSVVGYGRAAKAQVQEMTKTILKLDELPKPDDTADALALAICHGHCAGSRINCAIAGEGRGSYDL